MNNYKLTSLMPRLYSNNCVPDLDPKLNPALRGGENFRCISLAYRNRGKYAPLFTISYLRGEKYFMVLHAAMSSGVRSKRAWHTAETNWLSLERT